MTRPVFLNLSPGLDRVGRACAWIEREDGFVLMTGTLFAPTQKRKPDGLGFTHEVGDLVSIRSPKLGTLTNKVNHCDKIPPWTFGTSALMRNLAARGLLR